MTAFAKWNRLAPDRRIELVRELVVAGFANSTISFKLSAPPAAIPPIAAQVRRELEATPGQERNDVELARDERSEEAEAAETGEEPVADAAASVIASPTPVEPEPAVEAPTAAPDEAGPDAVKEGSSQPRQPAPEQDPWASITGKPDWRGLTRAERDLLLLAAAKSGFSARQITEKFDNCTRSAVIGRIYRLQASDPSIVLGRGHGRGGKRIGLATPSGPKQTKPKQGRKLRRSSTGSVEAAPMRGPNNPHALDFKARAAQRAASPGIVIRREFAFNPIPGTTPVAFAANTLGCKFPVDGLHGSGLLVCGQPKEIERSYCPAHTQLARQTVADRRPFIPGRKAERITDDHYA